MQPTFLEGWTRFCLGTGIAATAVTALALVAFALAGVSRRSWWGFLALPLTGAWSWAALAAAKLHLDLVSTLVLVVAAGISVYAGWWWLSHHK